MWATILLTSFIVLSSTIHNERHEGTSDEAHLTSSESNSVNMLRQEFMPQLRANYMKTDAFFQRFLKSNNFDVTKTRKNLLQFIDWRQENLSGKQRRDLSAGREISIQMIKDREGNPVLYHDMSKTNLRKLVEENQPEEFPVEIMKALDTACETNYARHQGERNVSQIGVLVDWTGFNQEKTLCSRCVPVYLDIVKKYEAYYPLTVKRLVSFNSPQAYKDVVQLMKPSMSKELRKAFIVYGTDQENSAKRYLENWIGKINLPSSILA